jgi:hypothetical protein
MNIDIKDYVVNNKRSKKAALKDMGVELVPEIYNDHSSFFPGDEDNSYDGERLGNEDYDDVADCGDEWYLD